MTWINEKKWITGEQVNTAEHLLRLIEEKRAVITGRGGRLSSRFYVASFVGNWSFSVTHYMLKRGEIYEATLNPKHPSYEYFLRTEQEKRAENAPRVPVTIPDSDIPF